MVKVILNGKPFECATCKEELTTGQYQRILKEWDINQPDLAKRDYLKLFSILTKSTFSAANMTVEMEQAIWECVSWVVSEPFAYSKELPTVLDIGGKTLTIPKKIGGCSIGQNVILKQVLDSCTYMEEGLSLATAIYLQPQWSGGKFDYAKAKELDEIIKEMPCALIYPVGFFLLNRALHGGKKSQRIWRQIQNSLSLSLKRMLPSWLKSKSYSSTTG